MPSLSLHIMNRPIESSKGTLLCPSSLLHLGSRLAGYKALCRLARKGELMRVCHGGYVQPIQTRFGPRPPAVEKVLVSLSSLWGETIVPCGGTAANVLGFTTQVLVRPVYLTSGPNRQLKLGGPTVELRHAPRWQMVAPYRAASDAGRALAWLSPEELDENLETQEHMLSPEAVEELAATHAVMPAWLTEPVSAMVADSMNQTTLARND